MSGAEAEDLRGLVDAATEQQAQLLATTDGLCADLSELRQRQDALVASTTAQHQRDAQWRQDAAAKLESVADRRRLASAVSNQRRGLSSDTCANPPGPRLLVNGVCSCVGDLLVEGRNVTAELDSFMAATTTPLPATTTASTTQAAGTWILGDDGVSCTDVCVEMSFTCTDASVEAMIAVDADELRSIVTALNFSCYHQDGLDEPRMGPHEGNWLPAVYSNNGDAHDNSCWYYLNTTNTFDLGPPTCDAVRTAEKWARLCYCIRD